MFISRWDTNTYTHARLLPIWVLVVDVEPLGRAQQLWKKTDKDKMTRGSKTGNCRHIWFFLFVFIQNALPIPQTCVCLQNVSLSPALLSVVTPFIKQPDIPDRMESFPRLPLPHPSPSLSESDTLTAAKWFINKWFNLAEMYDLPSFTSPSYHSSLKLRVTAKKTQACTDKRYTWCKYTSSVFLTDYRLLLFCSPLSLEETVLLIPCLTHSFSTPRQTTLQWSVVLQPSWLTTTELNYSLCFRDVIRLKLKSSSQQTGLAVMK